VDGFGRSLDRGYEANTRTATIETTSFHLIIEKPRCVLLRLIDAPHTAGILVGARRRGGLQQRGIFSFWTPSRDGTSTPSPHPMWLPEIRGDSLFVCPGPFK
jgi:hypothetical protein